MTAYTVYSPPQTFGNISGQHDQTVLIPEATALWALAFPFFWLLWYRLWWASLFYGLLTVIFVILLPSELSIIIVALTTFPGLFLFLEGQELRRKMLERRGWHMVATVEGEDMASAEYRYFHSVLNAERLVKGAPFEPLKRPLIKKFAPNDTGIEFPGSAEPS